MSVPQGAPQRAASCTVLYEPTSNDARISTNLIREPGSEGEDVGSSVLCPQAQARDTHLCECQEHPWGQRGQGSEWGDLRVAK